MQLGDSKLYIANLGTLSAARERALAKQGHGFISRLRRTSASERLLALMLATLLLAACPALLSTVRSTVSLTLKILLEAGHLGLIAFQIFSR